MKITRHQIRRLINEENHKLLQEGFMDNVKGVIKTLALGYRDAMGLVHGIKKLADETDQSAIELVALLTTLDTDTLSAANERNGVTGVVELLTQRVKFMGAEDRSSFDALGVDALTELPSMAAVDRAVDAMGLAESNFAITGNRLEKIIREEILNLAKERQ
jgi:hypothetical protein